MAPEDEILSPSTEGWPSLPVAEGPLLRAPRHLQHSRKTLYATCRQRASCGVAAAPQTPVTHKGSLPRTRASPRPQSAGYSRPGTSRAVGRAPPSRALASLLGAFKSSRGTLPKTDGRRYPVAVDPPLSWRFWGGLCVFGADFHGVSFRGCSVLPGGFCRHLRGWAGETEAEHSPGVSSCSPTFPQG